MSFVLQQRRPSCASKYVLKPAFGCLFSALFFTVTLSAATDAPDSAEQQRILNKVRQSATNYLESLPNFVCSRITEQYQAGKKPEHWKQRDTITDRLIFSKGKENVTPELVNGKPPKPHHFLSRPLETGGEFGGLVGTILDDRSAAQISWSHWEDLQGHRLAVFEYSIDAEHSRLTLGVTDDVVVPYRGFLYADPGTGDLWRITSSPFDMPPSTDTKSLTTTVDYGRVDISGKAYLLPVSANIILDTGKQNLLNKVAFAGYRKFETESKITFVTGSN